VLITAGPTHEPIDEVRFIGNRSSGRLGTELATEAARRGHRVTLLLGPVMMAVSDTRAKVKRFRTTAELQGLLDKEFPRCDVLIQAAAVADYTLDRVEAAGGVKVGDSGGKLRRQKKGLVLHLKPTPDLLARCVEARERAGSGQLIVGFALEPAERMLSSAREKLTRKGVDAIVANELKTMDAKTIRAVVVMADGREVDTGKSIPKSRFAGWLLQTLGIVGGKSGKSLLERLDLGQGPAQTPLNKAGL
jgi:phosphopantothenoylcysteine decarboxylase/phosphopantothenate--cysteine ligase